MKATPSAPQLRPGVVGGTGGGSVLGRLPAVVYYELLGGEPCHLAVEPSAGLGQPQHSRALRGVAARRGGAQRGAVDAPQCEQRGGHGVGVHDAEQLHGAAAQLLHALRGAEAGVDGGAARGVRVQQIGARGRRRGDRLRGCRKP